MSTIFVKSENINSKNHPLLKSIPPIASKKQNNNLKSTHIEWRWRIFKFPDKKNEIVEEKGIN
jgi:hypothetical protein